MKNMMKNRLTLFLALIFAGSAAFAADFTYQDTNDNGKISKDEFYGTVSDAGIYSDWDLDNDGFLVENELNEVGFDYDYDTWDADSNGYLDAAELYDGYYNVYDADENGHWDGNEWDDAGDAGFFDV